MAGVALRKLESADGAEWTPSDIRGSVQLTFSDAALLPLMTALRLDRTVTFPYRTPADRESHKRTVSPWGLRSAGGGWFVVGHDHDRDAVRTFRLSRITGAVTVTARPRAVPAPEGFDITKADPGPAEAQVVATIRVTPDRATSLRRRAIGPEDPWDADVITVAAATLDELVPLVCAAGRDAVVLEPEALKELVVARLERLRAAHEVRS